jgi:predicted 2-oxoglutarate/Fe(II)-dependent dioxygenase YbiX
MKPQTHQHKSEMIGNKVFEQGEWVDGRVTIGYQCFRAKDNLQSAKDRLRRETRTPGAGRVGENLSFRSSAFRRTIPAAFQMLPSARTDLPTDKLPPFLS